MYLPYFSQVGRVGTAHLLHHPHLGMVGCAYATLIRCMPATSTSTET